MVPIWLESWPHCICSHNNCSMASNDDIYIGLNKYKSFFLVNLIDLDVDDIMFDATMFLAHPVVVLRGRQLAVVCLRAGGAALA